MIRFDHDGTVTLIDDADPARTQVLASGWTATDLSSAADTFFGPPSTHYEIPKSTVQERVNTLGLWSAVMNVLMPGGVPTIYYARWFAPDWPNVYADDAGLLQILQAAGATAAQIAQITASA